MNSVLVRYAFPDEVSEERLQSQMEVLSSEELDRYHRFKYARHRHQYLAAHLLLRYTLGETIDIDPSILQFGRHPLGKPFLSAGMTSEPIDFSLTHTEGIVACAVSQHRIGIDAEWTDRRYSENLVHNVLSPLERADVQSCLSEDRLRRFLEYWTLKESILKATGKGLTVSPSSLQFMIADRENISMKWIDERPIDPLFQCDWRFLLHTEFPKHLLAVAVASGTSELVSSVFEKASLNG